VKYQIIKPVSILTGPWHDTSFEELSGEIDILPQTVSLPQPHPLRSILCLRAKIGRREVFVPTSLLSQKDFLVLLPNDPAKFSVKKSFQAFKWVHSWDNRYFWDFVYLQKGHHFELRGGLKVASVNPFDSSYKEQCFVAQFSGNEIYIPTKYFIDYNGHDWVGEIGGER
jgi:hypothetical protein